MNILFAHKKLEKYANDDKKAVQKLGQQRAKIYKQRLDDLAACDCLDDVRHLPGKYHQLTSNRDGQWACHLDGAYRLIFEPQPPIPMGANNEVQWDQVTAITIVEIVNYH